MEEKDINFKYNECIKSYDKWGENIYQNICTGEKTTIPWAVGDYGIAIFLFIMLAIFVTFLVLIIRFIIDELIGELIIWNYGKIFKGMRVNIKYQILVE